jgi:hypothetical protein
MVTKTEFTMEVKFTLRPLWSNNVQKMIPRDSPQLTKQITWNITRKNDPTVSRVSRIETAQTGKSGNHKEQSTDRAHCDLKRHFETQVRQEKWFHAIRSVVILPIKRIPFIRVHRNVILREIPLRGQYQHPNKYQRSNQLNIPHAILNCDIVMSQLGEVQGQNDAETGYLHYPRKHEMRIPLEVEKTAFQNDRIDGEETLCAFLHRAELRG